MGSVHGLNKFDLAKKQSFLELFSKWWPNIYKTAEAIGITPQTYYNHLKSDKDFALAVENLKQARLQRIETVAVESAENPTKGFLDRAMILRAYKPELYDRAKVIKVEGLKMSPSERHSRLSRLGEAVDAEITQTYLTKREKREQRQLKRGSRDEERSGK